MQQYLIKKKKISKSSLILTKLKYNYLTACYLRKINLKNGRLAATCSSPKCINELKKIFKVIKKIACFRVQHHEYR